MELLDERQPQLTAGHFDGLFMAHAAECHERTGAVAIADVAIDDATRLLRLIQNLLGIDRHEDAGMGIGILGREVKGNSSMPLIFTFSIC